MRAADLKSGRRRKGWSQAQLANRLHVGQSYVAMLETGKRSLPLSLARKAVKALGLPPSALPHSGWEPGRQRAVHPQVLAEHLAALGYPGFAHLRSRRWHRNPAEVLLTALGQHELEARAVEALPWVLVEYPGMDAEWLAQQAKLSNLQNRLGFLASLASQVAARTKPVGDSSHAALTNLRNALEESRLATEGTLGRVPSEPERRWLRENRPAEAKHWNLLTDWRMEMLPYAGR